LVEVQKGTFNGWININTVIHSVFTWIKRNPSTDSLMMSHYTHKTTILKGSQTQILHMET